MMMCLEFVKSSSEICLVNIYFDKTVTRHIMFSSEPNVRQINIKVDGHMVRKASEHGIECERKKGRPKDMEDAG